MGGGKYYLIFLPLNALDAAVIMTSAKAAVFAGAAMFDNIEAKGQDREKLAFSATRPIGNNNSDRATQQKSSIR